MGYLMPYKRWELMQKFTKEKLKNMLDGAGVETSDLTTKPAYIQRYLDVLEGEIVQHKKIYQNMDSDDFNMDIDEDEGDNDDNGDIESSFYETVSTPIPTPITIIPPKKRYTVSSKKTPSEIPSIAMRLPKKMYKYTANESVEETSMSGMPLEILKPEEIKPSSYQSAEPLFSFPDYQTQSIYSHMRANLLSRKHLSNYGL